MKEKVQAGCGSGPMGRMEWLARLEQMGRALERPTVLTLIGSGAGLLAGQVGRVSIDLTVWRRTSEFLEDDLARACRVAGLLYGPRVGSPTLPCLQVVDPGLCQVGEFEPEPLCRITPGLEIRRPPAANLVASKLLQASPSDLADMATLRAMWGVCRGDVEAVLEGFPQRDADTVRENLVYLDVFAAPGRAARTRVGGKGKAEDPVGNDLEWIRRILREPPSEPNRPAARNRQLAAIELLRHQELIAEALAARDWDLLLAVAEFVDSGPLTNELAFTDPALFRDLSARITTYRLAGWGYLNPATLRGLGG